MSTITLAWQDAKITQSQGMTAKIVIVGELFKEGVVTVLSLITDVSIMGTREWVLGIAPP